MTQVFVSMGFFPDDYFAGTTNYIAKLQDGDGAIPWFDDGPMDPWDHIESAMDSMGKSVVMYFVKTAQVKQT